MIAIEIVNLGASSLKDGSPRWQSYVPIGNDNDDILPLGELPVYQGLGLTSLPEGKDASGSAEGVVVRNVSGRKGAVIGARDTRDADIVGKLDQGDTVLHATGNGKKPQLQLKKKKRIAATVVPCEDGTDALLTIDGKNHRFQFLAWGMAFQMSKKDGITISDGKGGGLQIAGGEVTVLGTLRLPGIAPGNFIVQAPISGLLVPGVTAGMAATTAPFVPVNGVGGTG